jgi:hypothetical protein
MIYDQTLRYLRVTPILALLPVYLVIGLFVGAWLGACDTAREWWTDVKILWTRE